MDELSKTSAVSVGKSGTDSPSAAQSGAVKKHALIIGLDFGHGEVAVHYIQGTTIDPLVLDGNTKDKTLMTALAYGDDGSVMIGAEAANQNSVEAYFKASPSEWDETTESGRKKKQLMSDYIRQLFVQIQKANAPLGLNIDPNNTLLLVGCPTSDAWLNPRARNAYAELVRQATGIQDVKILPESRAAIFSAFHLVKKLVLDTTKGVAVFDFGSSTADFTYYLLGKKRYEFNYRLGASRIEQAIVGKMMEQLQDSVVPAQIISKELEVRKLKEAFFTAAQKGQDYSHPIMLEFVKQGYDGQPKVIGTSHRTGKPMYDTVRVAGSIDENTIEWATEVDKFSMQEDETHAVRSWYGHCQHFFEEAKDYLRKNNFPCETIILTGGASRMDFVRNLCQEIFPDQDKKERIYMEENPSYSVSIGLCYLAHGQEALDGLLAQDQPKRREELKSNVDALIDNIASEMSNLYYEKTCVAMRSLSGKVTVGVLTDTVKAELGKITSANINEIVGKHNATWKQKSSNILLTHSQEIVKKMYPGLEGAFDTNVSQQYLKAISIGLDANRIVGTLDLASMVTTIIGSVVGLIAIAFLFCILISIPVVGWILASFCGVGSILGVFAAEKLSNWIANNREFDLGDASKNLKRYEKKKDENIAKMKNEIKQKVQEQLTKQMGEDYATYLDQMDRAAQETVEILSLQRFPDDNK